MDLPVTEPASGTFVARLGGALALRPGARLILALCLDDAAIAGLAPWMAGRTVIDSYSLANRPAPSETPADPAKPFTIRHKGVWRADARPEAARYDCVLADLSHIASDLGRVIESLAACLQPNGVLACTLPFGWKRHGGYPYLLSDSGVIRLMQTHKLSVQTATICPDEVHGGYAYFLLCRPDPNLSVPYLDESRYLAKRFTFVPHGDACFVYNGSWGFGGKGERIARDATANFAWSGTAEELLIVCERHPWSGIGEFHIRGKRVAVNLLSWFAHTHAEQIFVSHLGPMELKLTGRSLGADRHALGAELVIHGVLKR